MVTHADRLTEHTNTLDTVTKLHRDELRGVRVVWIEVEAMPPKLRGVVRIRLTRGDGLTLRVWATIEPASRGSLSALARSSAEPPRVCTV
jgi:hypothetical protein